MNKGLIRNLKVAVMWLNSLIFVPLTYLLVWLDRKIKFSLPFPRDIASLAKKEKWCIDTLKKNKVLPPEAEIEQYKVTPLRQEIIFRSNAGVIEIKYKAGDETKSLKCFAKFAPVSGSVWNRVIFNLQMNHMKEIYFNRYFVTADKSVAAPEVYYADTSFVTANLCLITEYIDSIDEYVEDVPAVQLEIAVEALATLHACYWKNTSKRMRMVNTIAETTVDFFDSVVSFSWGIPARKILVQSWNRMNEPQTVIHGDARIGNMLFPKEEGKGRFVLIDWQAVRKGKGAFDLAYFLVLSLSSQNRVAQEQQTIDNYYKCLQTKGVNDYSKEELEEDYRHACLCVLVLLSLPMLSGEASIEGDAAKIFAWGMNVWRVRVQNKFADFDYAWLTNRYGITEQEGRNAIAEMLGIIEERLKRIGT